MNFVNIAVDGPAGAGKSTISKALAKQMGYVYIDTGAMYRATALKAVNLGIDIKNDIENIKKMLHTTDISLVYNEDGQRVILDGKDVSDIIRTPEVSVAASNIAVIPEVRIWLVELQRQLASKTNCIMDGRDIGTYVLPNANIKIFLTASVSVRAKRRYDELIEKGMKVDYNEVLEDMKYRDKNDSSREFAPLKPADDSILVDTSDKNLEQSVKYMQDIISDRLKD